MISLVFIFEFTGKKFFVKIDFLSTDIDEIFLVIFFINEVTFFKNILGDEKRDNNLYLTCASC